MMTDKQLLELSKTVETQEKIKNKLLSFDPNDNWKNRWKSMSNCEKIDFVKALDLK